MDAQMSDSDNERDRDFAAITEKEIFDEAADRLQICIASESDNRRRAKEATEFREGKQWDDEPVASISQDEPEMTVNLTDALLVIDALCAQEEPAVRNGALALRRRVAALSAVLHGVKELAR